MKINMRHVLELVRHVMGPYIIMLFIVPLMVMPNAVTGLAAKGVFDVLQGFETVSLISDWVTFEVGTTVEDKLNVVFWLIGGLVTLHVLHAIPYFVGFYWFNRLMHLITSLLQKNMLASLYRRPGAESLPDSAGEAISRFRGDAQEAANFVWSTHNFFANILVGALALVLLMSVDAMVTSIVFLPLLIVVMAAHVAQARVKRYREAARETTGKVTGLIGEVFGAVQAVQVAGAEDRVIRHFKKINLERRKAGLRDLLFNNILGAVFGGVSTIGLGMVLLLVGQKMRSGDFTAGDFALYQYYLSWIMGLPAGLGMILVGVQQLGVSMKRMQALMIGEPEEKLFERSSTYLWGEYPQVAYRPKVQGDRFERLDVSGLTYTYDDGENGIRDIDLSISRGDFVAVTGRVGSGKSTLLRAVLGLLPAQQGEIRWNREPIASPDPFLYPRVRPMFRRCLNFTVTR